MSRGKQVDPDKLRMLAKRAGSLYSNGLSLNDAVVNVVKDEPDLGTEHIRRVIEFANNETFQNLFKTASGDHRIINFNGGPADPTIVLKELNMGAVPAITARSDRSYEADPYVPGSDSAGDPFETSKTAEYVEANPNGDIWRHREQLIGLKDHFESEHIGVMARYDDAVRDLQKEARQIVLDGGSSSDIARVFTYMAEAPDMAKLALRHVSDVLKGSPVKTKVAGMPNPSHPLSVAFCGFQKIATDRFRLAAAIDEVNSQLSNIRIPQ